MGFSDENVEKKYIFANNTQYLSLLITKNANRVNKKSYLDLGHRSHCGNERLYKQECQQDHWSRV